MEIGFIHYVYTYLQSEAFQFEFPIFLWIHKLNSIAGYILHVRHRVSEFIYYWRRCRRHRCCWYFWLLFFCSSRNFSMQSHVYGPNDMGSISDTTGKRTLARTMHININAQKIIQYRRHYQHTQRSTRQLPHSVVHTYWNLWRLLLSLLYFFFFFSAWAFFLFCCCCCFVFVLQCCCLKNRTWASRPFSRLLQRLCVYVCLRVFSRRLSKKVFTLFPFEFLYCCYFTSPTVVRYLFRYEKCTNDTWICDSDFVFVHKRICALLLFIIFMYNVVFFFLPLLRAVFFPLDFISRFFIARECCLLVYAVEIFIHIWFESESESVTIERRAPTHAHCIIALRFHHNVYFVHLSAFTFNSMLLFFLCVVACFLFFPSYTRSALVIHAYTYV